MKRNAAARSEGTSEKIQSTNDKKSAVDSNSKEKPTVKKGPEKKKIQQIPLQKSLNNQPNPGRQTKAATLSKDNQQTLIDSSQSEKHPGMATAPNISLMSNSRPLRV